MLWRRWCPVICPLALRSWCTPWLGRLPHRPPLDLLLRQLHGRCLCGVCRSPVSLSCCSLCHCSPASRLLVLPRSVRGLAHTRSTGSCRWCCHGGESPRLPSQCSAGSPVLPTRKRQARREEAGPADGPPSPVILRTTGPSWSSPSSCWYMALILPSSRLQFRG